MDISKIDKNFAIETSFKEEVVLYDAENDPVKIHGIFKEHGKFVRMPYDIGKNVNSGVEYLLFNTAGGRARFATDSPYIAIKSEMNGASHMTHMAMAGSAGFDLYVEDDEFGETYVSTYRPPLDAKKGFDGIAHIDVSEKKMRTFTIHFPTYSCVNKLYIGLAPNSKLEKAKPYINTKPIVYYGSSITQGGCVSKPGDTYQDFISRRFNVDYINLGFSGSAKGEDVISDYIKSLDMSIFVYDYDHNAPTPEHLKNTHEKMFLNIRKAHPDIPVIIMSRPRFILNDHAMQCLEVIKQTYNNAVMRGDKNVYLLTGAELTALCKNEGTVDGTHPTSFGFFSMAKAVGDVIEDIITRDPEVLK